MNKELCKLQVHRLGEAADTTEEAKPCEAPNTDPLKDNKHKVLQELKKAVDQEIAIRDQLAQYLEELKLVEEEDMNKFVKAKPDGELVYEEASGIGMDANTGIKALENNHQNDCDYLTEGLQSQDFNLEDYLTFDED